MFRPRVIPVLLLKNQGLVKTIKFDKPRYIGDPINAVRIFNDLKADELAFLDILASKENRLISLDFVRDVGEEANMPFSVGGGIKSIEDIRKIINAGAEKVIINSYAAINPDFISAAADAFGSSTIVVCIDVRKRLLSGHQTYIYGGNKSTRFNPLEFALLMQEKGAGEIIVQSIEKDGMMDGYDIELISNIAANLTIPVISLGGAGKLDHLVEAYQKGKAGGLAAGSMFVYHGPKNGVLINYPEKKDLYFNR